MILMICKIVFYESNKKCINYKTKFMIYRGLNAKFLENDRYMPFFVLSVEYECKFCYNILWLPFGRLQKGVKIT